MTDSVHSKPAHPQPATIKAVEDALWAISETVVRCGRSPDTLREAAAQYPRIGRHLHRIPPNLLDVRGLPCRFISGRKEFRAEFEAHFHANRYRRRKKPSASPASEA